MACMVVVVSGKTVLFTSNRSEPQVSHLYTFLDNSLDN